MKKPRLLDLFCKAGGAGVGYARAGFEVVGVDIEPQPRYAGDRFHQADALTYSLDGFDVIHASPPCQIHSCMTKGIHKDKLQNHLNLIPSMRVRLIASGKPYIIENVVGAKAHMINPVMLCGSMFSLKAICHDGIIRQLRRHRLIESSHCILMGTCQHKGEPIGVYGHGGGQFKTVWNGGHNRGYMGSKQERIDAMGIDWMTNKELSQAIPPAYTEYIGKQIIKQLKAEAA